MLSTDSSYQLCFIQISVSLLSPSLGTLLSYTFPRVFFFVYLFVLARSAKGKGGCEEKKKCVGLVRKMTCACFFFSRSSSFLACLLEICREDSARRKVVIVISDRQDLAANFSSIFSRFRGNITICIADKAHVIMLYIVKA